jgi:hypothetical protein
VDVALASPELERAVSRVRRAEIEGWSAPDPPDLTEESNDVFPVCHLLHQGTVVDLFTFRNAAFTREIIDSARSVSELGGIRFIRPELLLVTHLLRPGPEAALAATELVIARRQRDGLDLDDARRWAQAVDRAGRLDRVLEQADAMRLI